MSGQHANMPSISTAATTRTIVGVDKICQPKSLISALSGPSLGPAIIAFLFLGLSLSGCNRDKRNFRHPGPIAKPTQPSDRPTVDDATEIGKLTHKLAQYEKQLKELTEAHDKALAAENASAADAQKSRQEIQSRIAEATSNLATQVTELKTTIEALEKEKTALQDAITKSQSTPQAGAPSDQKTDLEKKLGSANSAITTLQETIKKTEGQLATANIQIARWNDYPGLPDQYDIAKDYLFYVLIIQPRASSEAKQTLQNQWNQVMGTESSATRGDSSSSITGSEVVRLVLNTTAEKLKSVSSVAHATQTLIYRPVLSSHYFLVLSLAFTHPTNDPNYVTANMKLFASLNLAADSQTDLNIQNLFSVLHLSDSHSKPCAAALSKECVELLTEATAATSNVFPRSLLPAKTKLDISNLASLKLTAYPAVTLDNSPVEFTANSIVNIKGDGTADPQMIAATFESLAKQNGPLGLAEDNDDKVYFFLTNPQKIESPKEELSQDYKNSVNAWLVGK